MLRPLSTLPLSNAAILELEKSGCHYVDDVKNTAPELTKKYDRVLSEQVPGNISALDLWQEELRQDHLTTFCDALDNILEGGFKCREITEICGAYGSGKSQICMQMSVVSQLPKECGGLNSQSLYIDTRNGFSPTRVQDVPMGVKGLATYVNRRRDLREPYKLHGGYVVIDGESLAIELYKSSTEPRNNNVHAECVFGGDYNIFVRRVKEFFDNLEKCEVTPLVIMDGGWEEKKMKTLFSRREDRLHRMINYRQLRQPVLPMNGILIFTTYLLQRQIKLVRTVFENDPHVAGVAKSLNCPVLSLDSDFYIFGTKYIPYTTLKHYAEKLDGGGYGMHCSIFKVEKLLKLFPGLDHSVLPLLAVLLGNDFIEVGIFNNFFENLEMQHQLENPACRETENDFIRKISVILKWLSKRKLNEAVGAILSTLPVQYRQKVLDTIRLIVNGYLLLPYDMLKPLGFTFKYQRATCYHRKFAFPGNVYALEARHYWRAYKINSMPNLGGIETELPFGMQSDLGNGSTTFANNLPLWFNEAYKKGELPACFISMMFHRLYCCAIQIEDPAKPSAEKMSLNLFRVIDGLLVAGRKDAYGDFTYVIREGTGLVRHKVPTVCGINSINFPALSELPFEPLSLRKRIFDETFELSGKESLIEDLPPEWRLFIAAALYWIDPIDETPQNTCHVYALLFTMLLGVVEGKFVEYRVLNNSRKTNYKTMREEIKKARRIEQNAVRNEQMRNKCTRREVKANNESDNSIIGALEAVTVSDCLLAANFFLNNCKTKEIPSFADSDNFDVTIVHAFLQFQCCLKYAIYLNALLRYPYKPPAIEKLFNGTMLYNLYIQFEKRLDVESYISELLEETPSLLRLLKLLIRKMKILVDRHIPNGYRERDVSHESNKMLNKNQPFPEEKLCDQSNEFNVENIRLYTLKARKLLNSDCYSDMHMSKGVTKRKNKKKHSN